MPDTNQGKAWLDAIDAWHGTPHDFGPQPRFDWSKIGTGEGAQAYGMGHYAADQRGIGEYYRNVLSGADHRVVTHGGQNFAKDLEQMYLNSGSLGTYDHHIGMLETALRLSRKDGSPSFTAGGSFSQLDGKSYEEAEKYLEGMKKNRKDADEDLNRQLDEFEAAHNVKLPREDEARDQYIVALSGAHQGVSRGGMSPGEARDELEESLKPWQHSDMSDEEFQDHLKKHSDLTKSIGDFIERWDIGNPEETGSLYQLKLNLAPDAILRWDDPMSLHHPQVVGALSMMGDHIHDGFEDHHTGKEIYQKIIKKFEEGDPSLAMDRTKASEAASKLLFKNGIHGIKYADSSSRHVSAPKHELTVDGYTFDEMGALPLETPHPTEHDRAGHILTDYLDRQVRYHDIETLKELEEKIIPRFSDPKAERTVLRDTRDGTKHYYPDLYDWYQENKHRLGFKMQPDLRRFNYVVFDDDLIRVVRKFNKKNEVVADYETPQGGVTLKEVDHDPFTEEK